ncbi:hypothetical protein VB715_02150 [Crocosphaera sp. UHCC 0190]|uniref:pilus assembly FimT family protein n=1 Tax=Crocosphaera sp. UHCC 0190 TaxID=3110246 RepID=UPI002B1F6E4D|nr:hypothetical protein [Crocosphaera sp. UHCC 0190]MEA5508558.1 hypothetical protein [Crocosphaera sp. UHCC 0190]
MVITTIVVGILSAFSIPSMIGITSQNQVKATTDQIKNLFQEAQRQSIRTGKICTVTVSATTTSADAFISSTPPGCLSTAPVFLRSQLKISTVDFPSTVTISYRGNVAFDWGTNTSPPSPPALIVVQSPSAKQQSCLTLTPGLGIIRTGIYNTSTSTCLPSL